MVRTEAALCHAPTLSESRFESGVNLTNMPRE
jgi:hypothetical protein